MLLRKFISKNNSSQNLNATYKVQAVLKTPKYDGYFLKWMMTSGHCRSPHCPPYGAVLPGASMNYTMMNQKGFPQISKSAQFFRSAYFPMDLPYVVIGTGSTPNFIDTVWIGRSSSKINIQVQKWRQIIPNSHLVVIPYSRGWELKHFLSTNKEGAISTLQALLLILFINGVIVFLFWLKERKEDRRNVQMAGSLNFIRLS
jgi:integrin alpha FG-GAP repeat containing protein 1